MRQPSPLPEMIVWCFLLLAVLATVSPSANAKDKEGKLRVHSLGSQEVVIEWTKYMFARKNHKALKQCIPAIRGYAQENGYTLTQQPYVAYTESGVGCYAIAEKQ